MNSLTRMVDSVGTTLLMRILKASDEAASAVSGAHPHTTTMPGVIALWSAGASDCSLHGFPSVKSQRDFAFQPRVGAPAPTLGRCRHKTISNPNGVAPGSLYLDIPKAMLAATPLGLMFLFDLATQGSRLGDNPGLKDSIPLGLEMGVRMRPSQARPRFGSAWNLPWREPKAKAPSPLRSAGALH